MAPTRSTSSALTFRSAERAASVLSLVLGGAMGAGLGAVAAARGGKPLHPRGAVVPAKLELTGGVPELGSLGRAGEIDVLARFSRAMGLPPSWPDIPGLALRWTDAEGLTDVLLASTGTGAVSRFVLRPRRGTAGTPMTSLMPFAGPCGPVLLAAFPTESPDVWHLHWSGARGPWRPFGTVRCTVPVTQAPDVEVRFDPVRNSPAGLRAYEWAAAVRRPAYRWSQRLGRRR